MQNKKFNIKDILTLIATVLIVSAHVVVIIVFSKAIRYYSIYPEVFNLIIIIVLCILIIIDIVFFIGLNHEDLIQKIIVCVLTICIAIGGFAGTTLLNKANNIINEVITVDPNNDTKTETISGVFVTYKNALKNITSLSELKSFGSVKVGSVLETSENSISSIGFEELDNAKINYSNTSYSNNVDLLFGLIGGDIDVAIFSNMYKAVLRADENVDYTQYLDATNEFGEFSKEVKVESNKSKKDLSKDPFNVLLIGWSPIIGSDTIGLADAIIVATVNPQTYTVSMMSIARDSYVPISCYGGECDKINSGRGTSMDCFVKTVEDLIGEEIDFYMEINFWGYGILIDCLGGVEIDNPVSFELDGVYVPAGKYVATGWQALEFSRERHHMPNGDFDRQQHQKEVIMQIAKKFLKHDLAFALDVFNEISQFLNTNMTLNQLAGVFNMLQNTKNYTGLSLFKILDMQALRITGYADWHYSDEYELPLWIYRLYQGSIDESLNHMHEVMGEYKTIEQNSLFSFNTDNPYVREPFYSTSYDEKEIHEILPPYYINLTTKTYKEAVKWAEENGATLDVTFIYSDDPNYVEEKDGMVISQSVAYGKKVENYPVCKITVMGKDKPDYPDVEDLSGDWIKNAKEWCEENGLNYQLDPKYVLQKDVPGYEDGQVYKFKYIEKEDLTLIKYYKICPENSIPNEEEDGYVCKEGYKLDNNGACKLEVTYKYVKDGVEDTSKSFKGTENQKPNWTCDTKEYSCKWTESANKSVATFTITKHKWEIDESKSVDATCENAGKIVYKCKDCNETKEEKIDALKHHLVKVDEVVTEPTCTEKGYTTVTYECDREGCTHTETKKENETNARGHHLVNVNEVVTDPTCTEKGYTTVTYECDREGCTHTETKKENETNASGHSWGDWAETTPATTEADGKETRECSVCHETETRPIPKLES